ncbi:MAG TPA: hypothetical protein VM433_14920 [Mycobacteriales bacterium]|nr:hypothetical protein [Mycobacteriales bacterium]
MTQPDPSDGFDAREGSGDPATDPAALGEQQHAEPDGDGGAPQDPAEG